MSLLTSCYNFLIPDKLLDIGVIDVETCKPAPNVLVDIWLANATGHYSGAYFCPHANYI
jgi:protocatechuate 3,4-dioxygenase beta subunit